MSKVAPPTEEVVKALLDYLVDPMLPLKASGKNPPPLSNQQSVAKQMHAVVLLYNYYQRKQHPELRFLEYESFCKLALNLKPVLIAHMNSAHQTETALSKDLGNQLSMTEKAIMDACNISLSLDALKDVPNMEAWPIAKVSVLLIDSNKENCVLLYNSITSGVWSVIEECLDVSNLDSEIPLEGTSAETMRVGKKTPKNEKDAKEWDFEHLAFAAVKKAAGINQTELKVLERHVVYSLSEEKTAAYFYIMQCIQSSKDFEVPIIDAIESLQGPLLRWICGTWMLTQVVEYYNVLPYSMIMSNWYLREVNSNGSERLNVSSFVKSNEHCDKIAAESEQAILNELQNFSVGSGDREINSSLKLENASDGEFNKLRDINYLSNNETKSSGNEAIADESSNIVAKKGQEMEKSCSNEAVADESSMIVERAQEMKISDESCDVTQLIMEKLEKSVTAHSSGRRTIGIDNSNLREMESEQKEKSDETLGLICPKQLENCIDAPCASSRTIDSGEYKTVEIEAKKTEKFDKSLDITLRYCGSEETIGIDNCNRGEKGVEGTENSDKLLDLSHSTVKRLENDAFLYISEGTTSTDYSKRAEKEVEDKETSDTCSKITNSSCKVLRNCIIANCSDQETIGDNSERIDKLVEDTEKSDKFCGAIKLTLKELTSDEFEDSKQYPSDDLQISNFPSGKRPKMDRLMMDLSKNRYKSMNAELPIRVYHHQKQKISLESDASTSVAGVGIYVGKTGTPKSVSGKYRDGQVAENAISGSSQSNLDRTAVADCALVSILAEKDIELTQSALGVLFSKRAKLCHQQRIIQDEVALCDENIQKILEGKEESLALKLAAIMDGCKDTFLKEKIQDEDYQTGEGHSLVQCTRGKRLSDAILNLRSPCQDLNDICCENNWALTAYSVSVSQGGFRANITVNGVDFDCSSWGELLSTPREARESAAARMIAQLREMSGQNK